MRNCLIAIASLFIVAVVANAVTLDALFKGSNPSGTTQIACATANAVGGAIWTDPATCGVAPSSSVAASGQPLCGTGPGGAAFEAPGSCGLAISSNAPTATGNVLCATSATASSYESPATCGLAAPKSCSGTVTVTVAAQSCSRLILNSSCSVTHGATCSVPVSDTFGTNLGNVSPSCYVDSNGDVDLQLCNPTTSSVTITSKTINAKVF